MSEISTSLEGMADYLELSTEPLTADFNVSAGQDCMEEDYDVSLGLETEETL